MIATRAYQGLNTVGCFDEYERARYFFFLHCPSFSLYPRKRHILYIFDRFLVAHWGKVDAVYASTQFGTQMASYLDFWGLSFREWEIYICTEYRSRLPSVSSNWRVTPLAFSKRACYIHSIECVFGSTCRTEAVHSPRLTEARVPRQLTTR